MEEAWGGTKMTKKKCIRRHQCSLPSGRVKEGRKKEEGGRREGGRGGGGKKERKEGRTEGGREGKCLRRRPCSLPSGRRSTSKRRSIPFGCLPDRRSFPAAPVLYFASRSFYSQYPSPSAPYSQKMPMTTQKRSSREAGNWIFCFRVTN